MWRVGNQQYLNAVPSRQDTDRHAAPCSRPPETRTPRRMYTEPDTDVDQFACCTAEYTGGTWAHARACPLARRR